MTESRRDLIAKVFNNEKADRVPVGFWHHFLGDEIGSDAFAHPELTDKVLAGQADFYKACPVAASSSTWVMISKPSW